jgi:hypothetical protein
MPRNYSAEYDKFHASPAAKKDRAARNKARRALSKAGRVKKGDGKDIDHADGNPRNNAPSNLKVMPKSRNRAKK